MTTHGPAQAMEPGFNFKFTDANDKGKCVRIFQDCHYGSKMKRRLVPGLLLVLGLASLIGCQMNRAPAIGLKNGQLLPCPSSPNCVCSQCPDADHQIDPIRYSGDGEQALARMKSIILSEPRTRIVEEQPGYLHAVFTSLVFRFQDDVEILRDADAQVLHVRSASRVGHSDLGVNRKRVERLRQRFQADGK